MTSNLLFQSQIVIFNVKQICISLGWCEFNIITDDRIFSSLDARGRTAFLSEGSCLRAFISKKEVPEHCSFQKITQNSFAGQKEQGIKQPMSKKMHRAKL